MRIVVNRERCVGAGQCVLAEPRVFDQSDSDGLVLLRTDHPTPDTADTVREAVSVCPSGALSLVDD